MYKLSTQLTGHDWHSVLIHITDAHF